MAFSGGEINISNFNQTTSLLRMVTVSVLSVLSVASIIVNIIIVVVLRKTERFHPVPRVILINTSVSDFLTDVVSLLFIVRVFLFNVDISTGDVVLVSDTIVLALYSVNSHSMTCHALVLYAAVCHSLKYACFTVKKTVLILALTWLWNIGLSFLHFIQGRFYTVGNTSVKVKITYDTESWWFGFVLLLNSTVFPVTVSAFCYSRIKRHSLHLSQSMWAGFDRSQVIMESTRRILVCFMFTILLWTTIHITRVFQLPNGCKELAFVMVFFFKVMKIGTYMYLYPAFRQTVRSSLGCVLPHQRQQRFSVVGTAGPATR